MSINGLIHRITTDKKMCYLESDQVGAQETTKNFFTSFLKNETILVNASYKMLENLLVKQRKISELGKGA